jgi:hypothetical protein
MLESDNKESPATPFFERKLARHRISEVTMARRIRSNFLARRSLLNFLGQIRQQSPINWPPHLFAAWRILNTELNLPNSKALSIILRSVPVAQDCVVTENHRVNDFVQAQTLVKVQAACDRISKCIKRAPAFLREELNQPILPLFRNNVIDLEVVESILETARITFERKLSCESAITALASLENVGKEDFSILGMSARHNVEKTLGELSISKSATAADVFAAMAAVLRRENSSRLNMHSRSTRKGYISQLAEVWRQGGLQPSRAIHPENPRYKSRFHRYAELVLTTMAEPWAKRHNGDVVLDTLRMDIWRAHANLPGDIRPGVSATLRRSDHEWLIADEYLKASI